MSKIFLLIRHGKTQSNLERRYASKIDEPLCAAGRTEALALAKSLPPVDAVVSAAALRCRETAGILFPELPLELCPLREIDFGVFGGKNADDLADDADYGDWLNAGCTGDIPGGGSVALYKEKCRDIFLKAAGKAAEGTTAFVLHGGNIMSIMEALAEPKKVFFDYHLPNCGYYVCNWKNGILALE